MPRPSPWPACRAHTLVPPAALFAALFAALLALVLAAGARAAPPDQAAGERPAAPRQVPYAAMDAGGLFLPAEQPGLVVPATTVAADVDIVVSGLVARTRVTQRFENPTDAWVEGVYVFPLPEQAAVDRLRLIIGERVVEGVIEEREAAQRRYEEARDAGQRASLVSQERPNLFTNAVANIAPHDSVTVEIEYQQTLTYQDGAFSLRFPMAVLPRYIPGNQLPTDTAGTGWSVDTDRVPDASRITPPVAHPAHGPVNPVTLTVELNPGFPVAEIDSAYHDVTVRNIGDGGYAVALADTVWADRDFALTWRPEPSAAPTAGVFSETVDGHDYHLVMIMPPADAPAEADGRPREVVFIIDTSGSMAGESIVQARQALLYALGRLGPADRFNVIAFNDWPEPLFEAAKPATPANVAQGRSFVRGLEAERGTEMRSALELALDGRTDTERMRQVVFITDGAVGNEAELFGVIHDRLGDSRLFTVGIGSAPNSHFMREAAEAGRGAFTHIGAADEVGARMAALFERLEHPALTDIEIAWPGTGAAAMYPAVIPDLYLGEPVVATVRLPAGTTGEVGVSGRPGGGTWRAAVSLDSGRMAPGVAALWARANIADLERQGYRGAESDAVRAQILQVALAHRIVSRYTSLVAIDDAVVRPPEAGLSTDTVATNMPHGVDMTVAAATPPDRQASLEAIRSMATTGSPEPVALPVGATAAGLKVLIGLACLLLAAALMLLARRLAPRQLGRA